MTEANTDNRFRCRRIHSLDKINQLDNPGMIVKAGMFYNVSAMRPLF